MNLYPRWKCSIIVRLEEFDKEGNISRYARARTEINDLKGKEPRSPLVAKLDPLAQAVGVRRWMVVQSDPSSSATGGINPTPPDATTSSQNMGGPIERLAYDNETLFEIPNIIPYDVQLGLNGFRQADTLSFKIRFADFPLDPRLMRAVAVKFYLGVVNPEVAATSLYSHDANDFLIPATWVDPWGRTRSNLRFKGWVDTAKVNWPDGDDEPFVEFNCRDNTGLLMEQEFPPKFATPDLRNNPIDQAIATLLSNFPQMEGFGVEYRPSDVKPPSLSEWLAHTSHQPTLGPVASGGGGSTGGSSKLTIWDYITDVVGSIGHVARVEDDTIVIQSVRTATSQSYPPRDADPYMPYNVHGKVFPTRTFVYGRDLQEITITRNYNKNSAVNVEVRCATPKLPEKVLVVRYPEKKEERVVDFKGATGDVKWTVYRVSGFDDKTKLRALAQSIYENLNRQEISITAKTQDLAAFGGDGTDPDLLDVKAGDTIAIYFRQKDKDDDNYQTFADLEETMASTAHAVSYFKQLGFDERFARRYSEQFQNAGFQNKFRVKSIGIACTEDEGVSMEFDLINYIEVRMDVKANELSADDPAQNDGGRPSTPNKTGSTQKSTPAIPKPSSAQVLDPDHGLPPSPFPQLSADYYSRLRKDGYSDDDIHAGLTSGQLTGDKG